MAKFECILNDGSKIEFTSKENLISELEEPYTWFDEIILQDGLILGRKGLDFPVNIGFYQEIEN